MVGLISTPRNLTNAAGLTSIGHSCCRHCMPYNLVPASMCSPSFPDCTSTMYMYTVRSSIILSGTAPSSAEITIPPFCVNIQYHVLFLRQLVSSPAKSNPRRPTRSVPAAAQARAGLNAESKFWRRLSKHISSTAI